MGTSDMPDTAAAAAPKVAPESAALRASPLPLTRLNCRMLAVGADALAAAVLGGTGRRCRPSWPAIVIGQVAPQARPEASRFGPMPQALLIPVL